LQGHLPSVKEDEPTSDTSFLTVQFNEHDLYVPPTELKAIAARAAARKLEKQRQQFEEEEEILMSQSENDSCDDLIVSPAELNAIAARAAVRKIEKQLQQQQQQQMRQPEAMIKTDDVIDHTGVSLIALRAQERRDQRYASPSPSRGPKSVENKRWLHSNDHLNAKALSSLENNQGEECFYFLSL
jgi:hypothetical protein